MVQRVRAVLPKRRLRSDTIPPRVKKWLEEVGHEFQEAMSVYPPKTPWKYGFPKKGPRRGGRRTGAYRKGWDTPIVVTQYTVTALNNVEYARYVGGPIRSRGGSGATQARHMRARGWPSQTIVGPAVVRRKLPEIRRYLIPYEKV